jgi:hypothetical protein
MTQKSIPLKHEHLPAFYQHLQTHPLYIDLTPEIGTDSGSRIKCKPQSLSPRSWRWQRECRRGLDTSFQRDVRFLRGRIFLHEWR